MNYILRIVHNISKQGRKYYALGIYCEDLDTFHILGFGEDICRRAGASISDLNEAVIVGWKDLANVLYIASRKEI